MRTLGTTVYRLGRTTTIPYIDVTRAIALDEKTLDPCEPGDFNWVYTCEYVKLWKENPRYATYHLFVKSIACPWVLDKIDLATEWLTDMLLATPENGEGPMRDIEDVEDDLQAARFAAVQEFHRRIMVPYENMKLHLPTADDPYTRLGVAK